MNPLLHPPGHSEESEKLYENLESMYRVVHRKLDEKGISPESMGCSLQPRKTELPLVSINRLRLPGDLTRELLYSVTDELKRALECEDEIDQLLHQAELDQTRASEFVISQLIGNGTAEYTSAELLHLVAVLTVRPFLSWLSEHVNAHKAHPDSWLQGNCPFCGTVPVLGRISAEDGRLLLWCWLCATEWRFPRMACPYCNGSAADGQLFFTVRDTPYRVELCKNCSRYLKILDERRLPEHEEIALSWIMNDLLTHHLDVLAWKEGYISPS